MENTATGPIRLSFESKQHVVVIPENEDRFLMTSQAAAHACQQAEKKHEWDAQFKEFLGFINGWCGVRNEKVRACFVTIGDHSLNVLVLLQSNDYDFDFDDDLAELDLALFQKFPLCKADVIQIPNQSALTVELSLVQLSSEALVVYGDGAGSPESGKSQ